MSRKNLSNALKVNVCLLVAVSVILLSSSLLVDAQAATGGTSMRNTICRILRSIQFVLTSIGSALVVIMFIYGGLKYVFSADDAGGRKQGKLTCIHAVIGGIIIIIASIIIDMLQFTAAQKCP